MSWLTDSLKSSIFRKLLMALTGLFLILFLTVHLAGNIQLIFNDEGQAFNIYAHTMAHNPFIQLVSKFNFAFIVLHVIYSIWLSRINKTARPVKYGYSAASTNSPWTSRNMGILGTLILVFLHFKHWGLITLNILRLLRLSVKATPLSFRPCLPLSQSLFTSRV